MVYFEPEDVVDVAFVADVEEEDELISRGLEYPVGYVRISEDLLYLTKITLVDSYYV